jgi:hypothetical protein
MHSWKGQAAALEGGARRYIEVYVLDDVVRVRAEPADAIVDSPALPAVRTG